MTAYDFSGLTDSELLEENYKEQRIRTESGERSEAIVAEYSKRKQARRVQALVDGMSDEEALKVVEVATARIAVTGVSPGGEG